MTSAPDTWLVGLLITTLLAVSGCAQTAETETAIETGTRFDTDVLQVERWDVIGEPVAVESASWTVTDRSVDAPDQFTTGGRDSPLLVGPGTVTLDDGSILDIPPETPGGNQCPLLDIDGRLGIPYIPDACVLVGEYGTDGRSVVWFATISASPAGDRRFSVGEVFIDGDDVLVRSGMDAWVAVALSDDVVLMDCFDDLETTVANGLPIGGVIDTTTDTIVGIECLSSN